MSYNQQPSSQKNQSQQPETRAQGNEQNLKSGQTSSADAKNASMKGQERNEGYQADADKDAGKNPYGKQQH